MTAQHRELIEELAAGPRKEWGESALLACLEKLRDGGPTEAALVEVYRAWAIQRGFKIVYLSPWGPTVGLTARAGQLQFFSNIYCDDPDADPTPEQFGMEVADFFVAEPLGRFSDVLEFDTDGLGWWGERTLP